MAKYTFKCPECNQIVEVDHPNGPPTSLVCHDHRNTFMKRVYELGGISFKGSGFYSTDK